MLYLCAVIIVLIGTTNSQNVSSEARDFSGYPSSHQYDTGYDSTGSYGQTMEKWIPPTIALPSLAGCGGSVTSLFKPILTALIGAALLKLPLLFIAKALLLKLALPFGVLVAASPIFLPLLYMMFTKNSQPTTVTMSTPKPEQGDGRELINFLESSSCLEHIACTIGNSQARSDTVKPVNW
ncbi:hypothetical protein O3M35_002302 [Rhynocoris fuscipes]|uniref:Uncharacterized protein n=1 Tax=Rhynocoris fuscipes TaxID=488301 RepID=A0AAW1CNZ4_9HEMI